MEDVPRQPPLSGVRPPSRLGASWLRWCAVACAALVAAAGAVALAGWFSGDLILAQVESGAIPMAPATALAFILSALAVCGLSLRRPPVSVVRACTAAIALLLALRVWEIATGAVVCVTALGFDVPPSSPGGPQLGKMALPTVLCFAAAAAAIFLLTSPRRHLPALALALMAGAIGLAFVLGYIYGTPLMYRGAVIPMALPTAGAFCLLGLAVVLLAAERELTVRQAMDQRLRAQEQVAASRQLLDQMVEQAPVGMALFDGAELRLKLHNPAYRPLLDPELAGRDILGQTLQEIVARAEETGIADIFRATAAGETQSFREYEFTGREGRPRHYNWATVPVPRPDEGRFDVLVIAYEVTEQVLARRRVEELAEQAQRQTDWLETVFASMSAGVQVYDAEGRTIRINDAGRRLLPYRPEEYSLPLSQRLTRIELLDEAGHTIAPERAPVTRVLQGETVSGEVVRVHREGARDVWLSINAAPIPDLDGGLTGAVVVFADITSLQEAREELRRHRDHLEDLVTERTEQLVEHQADLRRLAAQLAVAEEHERNRIGTAIHDEISQLLAFARLRVQLLPTKRDDPQALTAEIEALADTIERMIVASRRLITELSPPVLYQMDFGAALDWLGKQMARDHGYEVSVEVPEHLRQLPQDCRVLLFQAARELLVNVAKHAHAAHAWLSVAEHEERLRLTVRDDGEGFEPAELQMTEDGGFGLFALRERLIYLGGELVMESAPGAGTTVTIVLPRGPDAGCATPIAPERAPSAHPQTVAAPSLPGD